jgi:hypothetical protein
MQDIGNTADTEFSRKDLALRWRELRVEVLQALSAYWKLDLFPVEYRHRKAELLAEVVIRRCDVMGMGRILIAIYISALTLSGQTSSNSAQCPTSLEPENHSIVVDRLMRYHDSGEYDREIREVADDA